MTPKKPRGRPAKTSREDIIDAACVQLNAHPFEELSLSALARSLGLTPMALYRYFGDKNALQQAIAERLLATVAFDVIDGDTWQQGLQRWATGLRDEFCKNPQLFQYMGWRGHVATAWVQQLIGLSNMLRAAGVVDEQLPMALKWMGSSITGLITITIIRQRQKTLLDEGNFPSDAQLAAQVMPHLQNDLTTISDEALFNHHVQQIIRCLEQDIARTRAGASTLTE